MNAKEAKDFLVEQTMAQAALENVPVSDLEKEMMYFTESDPTSCANPLELNEKFEAEYDTPEYEVKIGRLLRHAYKRLKAEDPVKKSIWDDAVRTLKEGDHYLLVLWTVNLPSEHRTRDLLIMVLIGLAVVAGLMIVAMWKAH